MDTDQAGAEDTLTSRYNKCDGDECEGLETKIVVVLNVWNDFNDIFVALWGSAGLNPQCFVFVFFICILIVLAVDSNRHQSIYNLWLHVCKNI